MPWPRPSPAIPRSPPPRRPPVSRVDRLHLVQQVAAAAEAPPELILDRLSSTEELQQLQYRLAELQKLLADSRLAWLGEAWQKSLAAYQIAKVVAKANGSLRTVISPLRKIFTVTRKAQEEEGQTQETEDQGEGQEGVEAA